MRLRKRGRNEHYAKPNRPGPGSDRNPDEYLVSGGIWRVVGIVLLLVLPGNTVLVVFGQCGLQTDQQEGEEEFSLQKSNKEKGRR